MSAPPTRSWSTDFFGFIRRTTVLNLYNNADVWDVLGYEGASFDKGGYINRGFNDLDWLPEPRIETYDCDPIVEISRAAVLNPGHAVHGSTTSRASAAVDTNSQPGATSAQQGEVSNERHPTRGRRGRHHRIRRGRRNGSTKRSDRSAHTAHRPTPPHTTWALLE